jgi:4-amino-4-deoxy-L-arabinose transferase-like glycosyltransferase
VGGLLKAVSMTGAVTLRAEMDYYLDRPEAFGRFYVVARAYSAAWGLIGIWAVFRLVRRFSTTLILPATAAVCFTLMPIVINGAHEAKPHLAGTVLVLLTALAGTKFVETGARRWWVVTGVLCGMAAGMVLSAAVAFVVIPLIALLRGGPWAARVKLMLAAGGIGVLVYCVTNPYVPINLARNPAVLRANLGALGEAKALTGASNDAPSLWNARRLVVDGASVVGGVIGILAVVVGAVSLWWWRENRRAAVVAVLVGTPASSGGSPCCRTSRW